MFQYHYKLALYSKGQNIDFLTMFKLIVGA